jgi:ABC-2 type transport system ATP-binding protein
MGWAVRTGQVWGRPIRRLLVLSMIPGPMTDAIDLRNVENIYRRRVHALRGISMQVRRGEIFGLLGPNGAGKSTLVKIMMHVVRPTRAAGTILDHPIGHTATLARIGYLPENHRFPRYLTGRQAVEVFSALAKVNRATRRRRSGELLETVGLTSWANQSISQYSKGMLQRLGLAAALGADPDLLVLDEPTDGVDPAGRRDIRQVLQQLRQNGKTVFINSHLLSELETVCDRVAILVQGVVARQGTIDELTVAKQCFFFEFAPQPDPWAGVWNALPGAFTYAPAPGRPAMGKLPDGSWCQFDGISLRVGKTEPTEVQGILDALRKQGVVIRRMHVLRPSLEELFFDAVGPSSAVGGASK